MKKIYFFLFFLIFTSVGFSQVYEMDAYNGQTVTTCKGQVNSSVQGGFVGYSGGYANNENYTVTFCSGTGSPIRANFYWVSLETNYDYLYIYDGPSTASPLIATLNGEALYPGVYTSTGTCLTFRFTSDGSTTWGGFNALLGCTPTSCGTNASATDDCGSSPIICNLNGYCGSTSGWFTRDHGNIEGTGYGGSGVFSCGSIQNNSWLSFIASATTASFQITSSLCASNASGIQAVVLSTSNCNTFSSVSNCVSQAAPGSSTLNATGLTVGTRYYIMVDGVDGNDCRYDVVAQSGVQTVNISQSTSSSCPGSTVTLNANITGGLGPFTYSWSPAPTSGQGTSSAVFTVGSTATTYSCVIGGACGSSQTATYTINPTSPSVNVSSSPTICAGTSTTLTATGNPSSPTVTFSNGTDYNIPDNNTTGVSSPITVSGLPGTVGSSIANVTLSLTHAYDDEVDIFLVCPNGTQIELSTDNGGTGDNYINTVFATGAPSITSGSAPFTGTYAPEQPFSTLSGCNLNGTWYLLVKDDTNNDTGTLLGWSISFNNQNTYSWTGPSGAVGTGSSVNVSPTTSGVYTVTATDASGCSSTNTVSVTVNPAPTMTSASTATVCSGTALNIPLSASASSSFSWIAANNANTTGESLTAQNTSTINNTITLNGGVTTAQTVTYSVTPTSTSGSCAGTTQTVTVTVNPRPAITAMSNVTNGCSGANIAVPNFTVTPGSTSNINWTVSPAGSGLAASGSNNIGSFTAGAAGTYTVTANAAVSGCSTTSPSTFAITINQTPTVTVNSPTVCSGSATTLTANGAAGYNWSTSQTTNTISVSPTINPTTYTVTGTTSGCISAPIIATVTVNSLPAAPTAASVSVCPNSPATLTATAPGGTYNWFNVSSGGSSLQTGSTYTTPSLSSPTTYYVQTTDGNGCTGPRQAVTVGIHPTPTIGAASGSMSPTVCSGSPVAITFTTNPVGSAINWTTVNGSNVGIAASGTTNISYTAPTVAVTSTASISAVVTNTVTGCSNSSSPLTGTITINPRPAVVSTSTAVCVGSPATITASGANTYSWNTGATGQNLTVSPGSTTIYTVTGTNTATTCTNTATGTITVNSLPNVASTSTTVCSGTSTTLVATGASSYSWSTGATTGTLTVNNPTSTTTYTVTGTDGNNCTNTATGTINVNSLPSIASVTGSSTSACSGATVSGITFNTSPAVGPVVTWTNSNTGNGLPASGTGNIGSYAAPVVGTTQQGIISVVVTNTVTGCSSSASPVATATVTINTNPTVSTPATISNPTTCGGTNGSLNGLNVSGANPITYSWNGGAYSGANISGLPAGNYSVTATDNNGCTVGTSYSLTDPNPPAAPAFSATTPPTVCAGGSVTLSVTTPVGGQTYNWVGPSGSMGTGTSITFTPTVSGSYNVYTTEAGCTGNVNAGAAVNVTVNANPTAVIISNATSICMDASTVLDGQNSTGGGVSSITGYQWLFNGSPLPGETNTTLTANQAGNYQLEVTNSNNCVNTSGNTSVTINPEPTFSSTPPNSTNTNCLTPTGAIGDVTPVTISGSAPDYTYSWYGASGLISSATITSTTAPALTNQSAGTYTLIVVDLNGCNDTLTASIVNDNAPNAPAINGTNPANCSGTPFNPITMNGTGGITWYSDPALTNVVSFNNPYTPINTVTDTLYVTDSINGCQSLATQVIVTVIETPLAPSVSNVSACQGSVVPDVVAVNNSGSGVINWYSDAGLTTLIGTGSPYASGVTSGVSVIYAAVQDSVCIGSAVPVTISVTTLPTINTTSLSIDSASCGGASDGNILGIAVGGTPNFTYVWNDASGIFSTSTTSPDLTNAPVGSYTLTVTDGNGCISSQGPLDLVSNATPPSPIFVTSSDTVYCDGESVSALTANAGVGTVVWYSDAGLTNQIGFGSTFTPTGITSNTTIYVVANNNSCLSSPLPVTITFNSLPNVSSNSPVTCAGGSVTLNGTGAATYIWDNSVTDGVSFIPAGSGVYTVTGTDANGCVNTYTTNVTVNPLPVVGATQGSATATCDGTSVTLNGTGADTYVWDNGVIDGVAFTPTASGSYIVTGTDVNGCTNTFTVSVTVNPLPTVDAGATNDTIPCGSNNYVITSASTSASNPVYIWTGPNVVSGANTQSPVIGSPGVYTLVVTDALTGCFAQDVINIVSNTVTADFTQDVTSGFNPLTVNFTNLSSGAVTYSWNFGDGNTSNATDPSNTFGAMGTYQVILTAISNGCMDTAMVTIIVEENSTITIPNIFSPNGDGLNDVLTIISTGIEEMNIDIFNRWGQKVFVISSPGQNWDGKLANGTDAAEGTYFYILRAVGYDKKEYEAQGPIMLVK